MKQSKIWEYTKAIVIALILALIIRAYVVQAFKIPSGSMIPTLVVGDHILVNKFIYGTKIPFSEDRIFVLTKPKRGDIVVFRYPKDPDRDFIKRVVGVGGDVIKSRNNEVFINGKLINEPYLYITNNSDLTGINLPHFIMDGFGPYLIPKDKLFVMGDNRGQSSDSRNWGYVDLEQVKGKAFIIYWSWDSIKNFPRFGRIGNLIH